MHRTHVILSYNNVQNRDTKAYKYLINGNSRITPLICDVKDWRYCKNVDFCKIHSWNTMFVALNLLKSMVYNVMYSIVTQCNVMQYNVM